MTASLSNEELLNLYGETCYEMGFYASERKYDFHAAVEARNKMREDLRVRLGITEEGPQPERAFVPERLQDGPHTDEDVLLAIIPGVVRIAGVRAGKPDRASLFAVIQSLNSQLRPMGWEYVLRPGKIVTLRHPLKRYTWPDETREP